MASPIIRETVSAQLRSGRPATLLIPLGSTEQHGPHLPVETDSVIAWEWAVAAARDSANVLVAPLLPFGSSGEHQAFPGTISIGRSALATVLVELVRSAAHDFGRFVFVSGHAGNAPALDEVVAQLRQEGHDVHAVTPSWPARVGDVDAHAGRTETALMLHLRPDTVGPFEHVEGNPTPLTKLLPELIRGGLGAVTESGVLGDPSLATAAEGEALFADLVSDLIARLER